MTTSGHWSIHGLVVRSPLEVAAVPVRAGAYDVDVVVEVCDQSGCRPEAGEVLAEVDDQGSGRRYTLVDTGRGWSLHFDGSAHCDILQSGSRTSVVVRSHTRDDVLRVLLSGPILTAAALINQRFVVHASAVGLPEGGSVAFVAPSGGGKSTIGALASSVSRPLLSDDALAVDLDRRRVWPGTIRPRLRAASPLGGEWSERSADGRASLPVPSAGSAEARMLRRVLSVSLRPSYTRVEVVPLDERQALSTMLGATPLLGTRGKLLADHFDHAVDLVESVRVEELRVPWDGSQSTLRDTRTALAAVLREDVDRAR